MNYIWGGMILVSVICAIITGRVSEVSNAILDGAAESVKLIISLIGMMCFWTGIMQIADKAGVTYILGKVFSPIMRRLFPDCKKEGPAIKAICMNITANLLGLGNAATPLGISAMQEMQKENRLKDTANNSMAMFVLLNTASIQLVPTSMAILRQKYGSAAPFEVMSCVWISSIASLLVGIIVAKFLEKGWS
jgi:spore maturation protein A